MEPWAGTALDIVITDLYEGLCCMVRWVQKWALRVQISRKCSNIYFNLVYFTQQVSFCSFICKTFSLSLVTYTLFTVNNFSPHLLCFEAKALSVWPFFKLNSSYLKTLFLLLLSLMMRTPLTNLSTVYRSNAMLSIWIALVIAPNSIFLKLVCFFSRKRVHYPLQYSQTPILSSLSSKGSKTLSIIQGSIDIKMLTAWSIGYTPIYSVFLILESSLWVCTAGIKDWLELWNRFGI